MRTWILRLAMLAVALSALGCDRDSADSAQARRAMGEVDAKVRRYDPQAITDPARHHYAVAFRVINGVLTPEGSPAEIRPGNPPYRPPLASGFFVIYRDANGAELGRYTIEDPSSVRSCDEASGKRWRGTPDRERPHRHRAPPAADDCPGRPRIKPRQADTFRHLEQHSGSHPAGASARRLNLGARRVAMLAGSPAAVM